MHSIFWFRTRQWVLSRVLHLTEHKKQTLLAAPDAVLLLPALFRKRRISRILLVTTPGFVRRGTLMSLLDGCKKENISVTIFSEIAPDPQIESVEQGFRLYQQIQAQAILAIGGGSVLDAAKLIGARVCCPKKTVPAMRGLLKVRRKLPPLFAVPTTAGTGSEATAAAVITDCIDGKPYKYAVNDLCLITDPASSRPASYDQPPVLYDRRYRYGCPDPCHGSFSEPLRLPQRAECIHRGSLRKFPCPARSLARRHPSCCTAGNASCIVPGRFRFYQQLCRLRPCHRSRRRCTVPHSARKSQRGSAACCSARIRFLHCA